MIFQSCFMSTIVQFLATASSSALSKLADVRIAVVGVFAFGVGMMHKPDEVGAVSGADPLQHLQVVVAVAEDENRPAADGAFDARDRCR